MLVIDTNIISNMMRDEPNQKVLSWGEAAGQLHTTTVTLAEIDDGIARLPTDRRKDRLTATATRVSADYGDVLLPFDAAVARRYAGIIVGRERAGRPVTMADAQLAAICASRQATLATRNTADFADTGIDLVNPWND